MTTVICALCPLISGAVCYILAFKMGRHVGRLEGERIVLEEKYRGLLLVNQLVNSN